MFATLKKQYPWNVLVFPAASEIGLEIHRALGDCKETMLYGANQPGLSLADFHFSRLHTLPSIHDENCYSHLQELIETQKIDAVFPAHDDVILWLAERADQLGAAVIAPPLPVCRICRSKKRTYEALGAILPVPRLWNPPAAAHFPLFAKPDCGQGSQRARRIENKAELDLARMQEPDLVFMEYLPGREYTVDCFSGRKQGLLFAKARTRMQSKAGIATLSTPADLPEARDWAEKIQTCLGMQGTWFFQMKEDAEGKLRLLEVGPRIAGSMALSRVTGPNFPLLGLYEAAGYELDIASFPADMKLGRSLDTRFIYDKPVEALYLDFDDTVIVHGEVNPRIMALVFQCQNRKIPVYLLTHHPDDIDAALEKFRLHGIFDRVIHVSDPKQPKAQFIKEKNAILIDDSFRERREAEERCGIRCFDAAGAVCLIDERR